MSEQTDYVKVPRKILLEILESLKKMKQILAGEKAEEAPQ